MKGPALALVVLLSVACDDLDRALADYKNRFPVQVFAYSCDGKADPIEGMTWLQVRVGANGSINATHNLEVVGARTWSFDVAVPPDGIRTVDVRGYSSDPATGGRVVSAGKVVIAEETKVGVPLTVVLRKVGVFSQPYALSDATTCQKMMYSRAGHTATELKNGKVFVAGGYSFPAGSSSRESLSATEFYNPSTNTFERAQELSINSGIRLPRAFHTATLLPLGQVLVLGGEVFSSASFVSTTTTALVYDPTADGYGALPSRQQPASIARGRHQAILDVTGKVLIVGGEVRNAGGVRPVDEVEWFDPETNKLQVVAGVTLPRAGGCAATVKSGHSIAVAGGSDGAALATEVAFFTWNAAASSFTREALASPPRLADPGRSEPACATLRDGADLLVLGGSSDPTLLKPLDSSEVVNTSTSMVAAGPSVGSRKALCAAQLQDGSVMAIGGFTNYAPSGPVHSSDLTVILRSTSPGAVTAAAGPSLETPRYEHTCTALSNGTVLVLGGTNETDTQRITLNDAWIYQPIPTD